jgi:hypothetical protein
MRWGWQSRTSCASCAVQPRAKPDLNRVAGESIAWLVPPANPQPKDFRSRKLPHRPCMLSHRVRQWLGVDTPPDARRFRSTMQVEALPHIRIVKSIFIPSEMLAIGCRRVAGLAAANAVKKSTGFLSSNPVTYAALALLAASNFCRLFSSRGSMPASGIGWLIR